MSQVRQTRWSQQKKSEGKCVSCGKQRNFYSSLCTPCEVKQRERMRLRRAA